MLGPFQLVVDGIELHDGTDSEMPP
jgi:hypothetical protein